MDQDGGEASVEAQVKAKHGGTANKRDRHFTLVTSATLVVTKKLLGTIRFVQGKIARSSFLFVATQLLAYTSDARSPLLTG